MVLWINKACGCIFMLVGWSIFFYKVFPRNLAFKHFTSLKLMWYIEKKRNEEERWGREGGKVEENGRQMLCKTLESIYTIWDKIQTSDKVGET